VGFPVSRRFAWALSAPVAAVDREAVV